MKFQRGAGLIEALIAILVLSIGIMGMLGMQTAAFRYEQTGWLRSALALNIGNMAERIRANANSAPADYAVSDTYASERTRMATNPTLAKDCNNSSLTCTPAELAVYDLAVWRSALNTQIPGAAGFITMTGTKGFDLRYVVTVAWYDKDRTSNSSPQTLAAPEMCSVSTSGIAARNCCPTALGASSDLVGVRCTNLEIVP